MTHADLVCLAARWLAREHAVVVTEMCSGAGEEPDAIGFGGRISTLVECKVSRSDFRADRNKPCAVDDERLGDFRYYCVPTGLVSADDMPPKWGLLYANGRGVTVIRKAEMSPVKDARGEHQILISCLRRIGMSAPQGVSVKVYTMQTKCRATLGVAT